MSDLIPEDRLWELDELYRGRFPVEELSYGKVRDFADSLDNLGGLARASGDMKDLQRCWMVKAILGTVEPGGRLLEIGAGEPLVAGLLTRLGYSVTVVDPYDGSDQGPVDLERFARDFPEVEFIQDRFPPSRALPGAVAGVYSISVLEHIQVDEMSAVMAAATAALFPGGCSIHAVDHVLAGWGADEHREKLEGIVAALGLSAGDLAKQIAAMESDPETYFVSAEAHNRWRGDLPYDQYTMRRIGSVNLFRSAG
jgi:hypothetical protein